MEGHHFDRPKKVYEGDDPAQLAREHIRSQTVPGTEKSIAETTQAERDALAQVLHDLRKRRDATRSESNKLGAKARDLFGLERGSEYLNSEADYQNQMAKQELSSGRDRIVRDEDDRVEKELRRSVTGPLRELEIATDKREVTAAFSKIDMKNLVGALRIPERSEMVTNAFEHALRYGNNPARESLAKITATLLSVEASVKPLITLTIENSHFYLQKDVFSHLSEIERNSLIRHLESTPEILKSRLARGNRWLADLCLTEGTAASRALFNELVEEQLANNAEVGMFVSCYLEYPDTSPSRAIVEPRFDNYLQEKFGIRYADVQGTWQMGPQERDVLRNLQMMRAIEEERPKGVERLFSGYGIREFARYPLDMLVSQLNEEGIDQPYGIIVFPQTDHNEAFDKDVDIFQKLYDDTRGHYGIKVFEVGSANMLARDLISLNNQYGEKNKISFAILGGHGTPGSITLGNWYGGGTPTGRALSKEKVQGPGAKRIGGYFVPKPPVILISCSVGVEGGIGQDISQSLDAEVTGPTADANIRSLAVAYHSDGRIILDAEYSVPKNVFSGGVLVPEMQMAA